METEQLEKMTTEEKQALAKELLADVADEFDGALTAWVRTNDNGPWDYADLTICGQTVYVGTSGGCVVSFNGRPHDPDGKVNDNPHSIRQSIRQVFRAALDAAKAEAAAAPTKPLRSSGLGM